MSYFDIAFICIVLIYTFAGMRRGLVVSLISMIRFIIAVPFSYYISNTYGAFIYDNYLKENFKEAVNDITEILAVRITEIVLFIVVLVLFYIITGAVIKLLKKLQKAEHMPLKYTNSFLGGVFGLVKALMLIIVICTVAGCVDLIPENNDTQELINQINSSVVIEYVNEYNPMLVQQEVKNG